METTAATNTTDQVGGWLPTTVRRIYHCTRRTTAKRRKNNLCGIRGEREREKKESKIIIIINRLCKEGFLLVPIGWCLDVDRSCENFLSPRTNNGGVLPLTTPCRPARAPPDVQAVLGLERVLFSRVRLDAPTS